ncbi:MFS transporter [Thermodesulfobacteriota bacterium]
MEKSSNIIYSPEEKWGAMLAITTGMFMSALDMSIINISLPTLMVQLNTKFLAVQWVMISYNLVMTSVMMGAARMGDMHDKKKLNSWGLLLFTIGSLLCGFSPNVGWMIAFRVLQGLGAVIIHALGMALVAESFPPGERGRVMGIIGAVSSVAFALGPAIGGLIIAAGGWRWIFLFKVPLGVLALWACAKFLPKISPHQTNQRFDILGAVTLFIALGCFALGMTFGQDRGFGEVIVQLMLAIAFAGVIVFLFIENKIEFPMVDLSLFKNIPFCLNLMMGFVSFVTISGFFLMPFFLQFVRHYTPKEIGFIMMVTPVCVGIFSYISGNLSDRVGTQGLSIIGMFLLAAGCLSVSTLTPETGVAGYLLRLVPLGIGLGTFSTPNNSAIMGAAPPERFGVASGLLSLTRSLAQTAGVPIMGTIFSATLISYTKMETLPDISEVTPDALVRGINMTYLFGGLFIIALTIFAMFLFRLRGKP